MKNQHSALSSLRFFAFALLALFNFATPNPASAQGTTPLRITCPTDLTNWICGVSSTAPVSYPAPTTTSGNCSSAPTVACSPPSGAMFILGTTVVTCTTTNRCGEFDACTFRVTVARDTTAPVIQCPTNITFITCSPTGAVVNFPAPTASDNADATPAIVCTPPSGSVFPPSTNVVVCTATDDCTNQSACTFTVTVRPPLIFDGLCHSTLGLAVLNVNTNDELEVTGLGTNGQDGVQIELGESQGLRLQMKTPPALQNARMKVRVMGATNGGGWIEIQGWDWEASAESLWTVRPGLARYGLKLLLRGEIVHQQSGLTGPFALPACTPVWVEHCWEQNVPEFPTNPHLPFCMSLLGLVCPIQTPSGPVLADALVLTPEDPVPPGVTLSAIEITGRNLPAITLRRERLMLFGGEDQPSRPHRAIGQARLVAQGGAVMADLAGASTGVVHGVGIDLDTEGEFPASRLSIVEGYAVEFFAAQGMEAGRALRADFRAKRKANRLETTGVLTVDVDASAASGVYLDIPGIRGESGDDRVRIYHLGQLVGSATLTATGQIARLTQNGDSMPLVSRVAALPSHRVGFQLMFNTAGLFTLRNGLAVSGDELRVLVDTMPPGPTALESFEITASGVDSFTIPAESPLARLGVSCPSNLIVRVCSTNPVPVNYPPPTVTGGTCVSEPSVVCVPPSGSLFPPGVTTVTCAATNDCDEVAVCSFTITIINTLDFQTEAEPNNALASAKDLGMAGFVAVVGRIHPAGDVDYYRFTAVPNSKAWITVDTGGTAWAGANSRDSVLTLYNGAGVPIEMDDNDGSGNGADSVLESGDASAIAGAALVGGTYYLSVAANAGGIIAPYRLYLTVTTNAIPPEVEPNNTAAAANVLVPAGQHQGVRDASLNSIGDEDWYTVSIGGPSLLHISVDGDPERDGIGTDTRVELFRKDGVAILFSANSSAGGGSVAEAFVYRLSIPGTYYLRVRSAATASGIGTYRVMVAHCVLPPTSALGIAHSGGQVILSWPAPHEPCLLRSSRDLRSWTFLDLTPTVVGDELLVVPPSGPPHQFFQLLPDGGWSNDTYHCCDANGSNCNTVFLHPHMSEVCDRFVFRCYETENSSECVSSKP